VLSSGVFQSLVEKHFPAPDRRKMFDLLTMGSNSSSSHLFDSSPVPSPGSQASVKRKLDSSGKLLYVKLLKWLLILIVEVCRSAFFKIL